MIGPSHRRRVASVAAILGSSAWITACGGNTETDKAIAAALSSTAKESQGLAVSEAPPQPPVAREPEAYPAATANRMSSILLPVRAAPENWAGATALIRSDINWANWLEGKKTLVGKWFSRTRDRADLIGGYPNDLVNPSTGAAVQWSMDMAEPPDGKTRAEISFKTAWSAVNRQNNISFAVDAAQLFQVTGDTRYAKLAADQLDFYADHYLKWPLRTAIGNARMFGQSLDEAASVLQLLEAVRALKGYASPAQRSNWRDALFLPIASNLQTYAYGTLNNINLWCAAATAAIGFEFDSQAWIDAGTTGPKGISAVMAQGVTKDGIWFEGTFAYNNYVLLALARFFDAAAGANRSDFVLRYAPDVQRMLIAPLAYRFEDGTLPSPGDTRYAIAPIDLPIHGALYRHVPTVYGLQYARGIRSWDTLKDPPARAATPPSLPPAQTTFSPDIRMASLRSGDWQAFIHFGQKTVNHAQEEALTYELVHGKTSIARDAGAATSYSSAHQNEYFARGVGNNVPLVDGQGQEQWALGEVKSFDPVAGTLDVLHSSYRRDASARRSYKLDANGFSETSRITLTSANALPHRLGVVFNTICNVQIDDPRAGVAMPSAPPAGSPGFKYWTGTLKQQAEASWSAKLSCAGGKHYELTVTGPGPNTVFRATAPNTPLPATRTALYVEVLGTDATFTTSIKTLR